jgi:hypothetical protein
MKTRSKLLLLCAVASVFATSYVTTRAHLAPPMKRRSIGRLSSERNEPLRLRSVKVNGQKVFKNQAITATRRRELANSCTGLVSEPELRSC